MNIEQFLKAKMTERQQNGLKLVVTDHEGNSHTLYPKDAATKARWIIGYQKKGYTVCVS